MRRFSQRNSLVTLNEINITPLLDLAFVLLIIFVITRPLLEQSMDLKLPDVGKTTQPVRINQRDIRMVEVNPNGQYSVAGRRMTLAQVENDLVTNYRNNPNMVVYLRCDRRASWDAGLQVMNICLKHGITRVSPQTAAEK